MNIYQKEAKSWSFRSTRNHYSFEEVPNSALINLEIFIRKYNNASLLVNEIPTSLFASVLMLGGMCCAGGIVLTTKADNPFFLSLSILEANHYEHFSTDNCPICTV